MSISKSPKISQFAVGHEGLHSLLLSEDGVVYFVGTARRGEDGDQTKARRPPKPVKPKVFSRLEGQNVAYVRLFLIRHALSRVFRACDLGD